MSWTPEQARKYHDQVVSGELVRRARERRELSDELRRRFGDDERHQERVREFIERAFDELTPNDDVEATRLRLLALRETTLAAARDEVDEAERLAIYTGTSIDWLARFMVETWRERGAA